MKNVYKVLSIVFFTIFVISCAVNENTDVVNDPNAAAILKTNLTNFARKAVASNQADNIFNNTPSTINNDDCFTLTYPFSITDGQTHTVINSEAEFINYASNSTTPFNFVFPICVTLSGGAELIVYNEDELVDLIFSCFDLTDICFSFNFPLSLIDVNGNEVVVNTNMELLTSQNIVDFVYPFTVTTSNGEVIINNCSDFDSLFNECFGIDDCPDCPDICFEIIYPLTLLEDNGTIVTINSDTEFNDYLQNLANDTYFTMTYPINVRLDDGTEQIINNDDEFNALLNSCN